MTSETEPEEPDAFDDWLASLPAVARKRAEKMPRATLEGMRAFMKPVLDKKEQSR